MIHLLYAGNAAAFDGIYLSTLSIAQKTASPLTVYILTMDYREKEARYAPIHQGQCEFLEARLKREHPANTVTLIDVTDLYMTHLSGSPNEENAYTPYAMLRLLSDRVKDLPDKLLYLDTDTLAAGDILPLWETDLTGYEYAAVRDFYGCRFFGINYINSGVMLWNLTAMRESGLLSRATAMCRKRKIFLSDQTALNRAVKHKKLLPRRFNEQKTMYPDTVIRHFSMTITWWLPIKTQNIKPWQVEAVQDTLHIHAFDPLLQEYLAVRDTLHAIQKEVPNEN